MRMKALEPQAICVYIAPMKALARERLKEWQLRFGSLPLNWKVLELSGDTSYDQVAIKQADILVCTPEKWDLVSRGWRRHKSGFGGGDVSKSFIERTRLLVLDEVHLLGEDRGAVLEAIVSRTRFISQFLRTANDAGAEEKDNEGNDVTRIIALSTSLANPGDVADWIGIRNDSNGNRNSIGVYNFQSTVRPVPTTVSVSHIRMFVYFYFV
jgi:replicative superfamily II helicase